MSALGIGTLEREAPGLATPPPAAGKPPPRRRRTLVVAAIALLLLLITLVALTTHSSAGGELDPRSAAPDGSRALAALLREQGVTVNRGSAAGPGRTVLVPFPQALTSADLSTLLESGADVVLVDPGEVDAAQIVPTSGLGVRTRSPGCDLDIARTAGPARLGGTAYVSGNAATSCYDGALLSLPAGTTPGGGRLTVLGSSDFLMNARLDQQGNAALAIGLLSRRPALTWYTVRRASGGTSLTDLLPASIPWALLQVVIGLAWIGVWRGRRLGPIVTEPLPVVVRAAETVLGRARLYAAARARRTAAEALRQGSRARLGILMHVDAQDRGGIAATPQALITAIADRTGLAPDAIADLLHDNGRYRADESDAALVSLAGELDKLEDHVREGARR